MATCLKIVILFLYNNAQSELSGSLRETLLLNIRKLCALMGGMFVASFSMSTTAFSQSSDVLEGLQTGLWELRYRSSDSVSRICVRTGQELIKLRLNAADCRTLLVQDNGSQVTVRYTCPGRGQALTEIRKETRSLVQIKGQGLENGLPFEFAAEGRRVGNCAR